MTWQVQKPLVLFLDWNCPWEVNARPMASQASMTSQPLARAELHVWSSACQLVHFHVPINQMAFFHMDFNSLDASFLYNPKYCTQYCPSISMPLISSMGIQDFDQCLNLIQKLRFELMDDGSLRKQVCSYTRNFPCNSQ